MKVTFTVAGMHAVLNMHILSSVYVFCSFLFLPFGLFLFDIPYTFLY